MAVLKHRTAHLRGRASMLSPSFRCVLMVPVAVSVQYLPILPGFIQCLGDGEGEVAVVVISFN